MDLCIKWPVKDELWENYKFILIELHLFECYYCMHIVVGKGKKGIN